MTKDVREFVRLNYARAISQKKGCCGDSRGGGCCGSSGGLTIEAVTAGLYQPDEVDGPLRDAAGASFGCGNPTALADLRPGEVVLDLGCGAGLDVLLAARRVAPGGKAYGLDMTGEMLAEARANKEKSGIENVEFLKRHIEEIPCRRTPWTLLSPTVSLISPAKDRALREACRAEARRAARRFGYRPDPPPAGRGAGGPDGLGRLHRRRPAGKRVQGQTGRSRL